MKINYLQSYDEDFNLVEEPIVVEVAPIIGEVAPIVEEPIERR